MKKSFLNLSSSTQEKPQADLRGANNLAMPNDQLHDKKFVKDGKNKTQISPYRLAVPLKSSNRLREKSNKIIDSSKQIVCTSTNSPEKNKSQNFWHPNITQRKTSERRISENFNKNNTQGETRSRKYESTNFSQKERLMTMNNPIRTPVLRKNYIEEDSRIAKKLVEFLEIIRTLINTDTIPLTVQQNPQMFFTGCEKFCEDMEMFNENLKMKNTILEANFKDDSGRLSEEVYYRSKDEIINQFKQIASDSENRIKTYKRLFNMCLTNWDDISQKILLSNIQQKDQVLSSVADTDQSDNSIHMAGSCDATIYQRSEERHPTKRYQVGGAADMKMIEEIRKVFQLKNSDSDEIDEAVNENAQLNIPRSKIMNVHKPCSGKHIIESANGSHVDLAGGIRDEDNNVPLILLKNEDSSISYDEKTISTIVQKENDLFANDEDISN